MKFLDTNVFLRFLDADGSARAEACRALLLKLDAGEDEATTSESVIAEVAYVLGAKAHYGLRAHEIAARLRPILMVRGLNVPNKRTFLHALDVWMENPRLDFEDALAVAHMRRQGIDELVGYDRGFDRVPGVRRTEP